MICKYRKNQLGHIKKEIIQRANDDNDNLFYRKLQSVAVGAAIICKELKVSWKNGETGVKWKS